MTDVSDIAASVDGVPVSITHGLDIGMRGKRVVAFHYNFLSYVFGRDDETIHARHYLGEKDVSVSYFFRDPETWPLALRVLIYLQLRYSRITVLGNSGYRPLAGALAKRVADGVEQYLRAHTIKVAPQ